MQRSVRSFDVLDGGAVAVGVTAQRFIVRLAQVVFLGTIEIGDARKGALGGRQFDVARLPFIRRVHAFRLIGCPPLELGLGVGVCRAGGFFLGDGRIDRLLRAVQAVGSALGIWSETCPVEGPVEL